MKHIDNNRNKFKEKEIDVKIYPSSSKEEIVEFFEKCLEFKGELNKLIEPIKAEDLREYEVFITRTSGEDIFALMKDKKEVIGYFKVI